MRQNVSKRLKARQMCVDDDDEGNLEKTSLINCGIAVNKMDTYVPPQPRIRNPDSYTNFLANVYATILAKLTFLYLICRLQRLAKRNEDGSEMAYSSAKFFEASCVS